MKVLDCCEYAPKSSIKAGEAVNGGQYMFFTSSSDESKRFSEYLYDSEGIIMGTGGNATLHYYNGKFAVSTDCVVLIPDERVRCKYLYYFFRANMDVLERGFKGAGLKHTNKQYIGDIEIGDIPPLDIQDKVIEIIDKVYEIISTGNEQVVALDTLIKSRFVEMFGDPEYNTKNLPVFKLSKLCKVGSSKRIYQSEQSTAGIPFLRISDLNERIDKGRETSELFIPFEKYTELHEQGLVPEFGDILVTSRGTLGKCYIVKRTDNFYFQDGMISWLSEMDENVTSLYIAHLFAMPGIQKQIANLQAGSTVAYLSIAMLKKLDIMLPPIEMQHQFAAFVHQVEKLKSEEQKKLEQTQTLFDSLMQKYFG